MFVKITNGQVEKAPYTIGEFRKSKPNVSFPKDIPTNVLESYGVYPVVETTPPTINNNTHTYSWTVEFVNGAWTQTWSTTRLNQEIAERNVRATRDRLLSACDWTQVADAPVDSQAWSVYRQALRDVTSQPGFPWDVTWPTKPE